MKCKVVVKSMNDAYVKKNLKQVIRKLNLSLLRKFLCKIKIDNK